MAHTQQEWFEKLKGWVPSWVFEKEDVNVATFQAIAKVLAEAQASAAAQAAQTFLDNATGSLLDLHGSERDVTRVPGESDNSYRERIRLIENTTSEDTLLALIRAVINNGEPLAIENWSYGFFDDEIFCDCDDSIYLSKTKNYNRFTIVVPPQDLPDDSFFKSIVTKTIDDNKALGTFGDIVYRVVFLFMTEDENQIELEDGGGVLVGEGSY